MWAAYNGFGECVADGRTYDELMDELDRLGIDDKNVEVFEVWGWLTKSAQCSERRIQASPLGEHGTERLSRLSGIERRRSWLRLCTHGLFDRRDGMAKLWNVELTYVAVVLAEDEESAWDVAAANHRKIIGDSPGPIVHVCHRIKENKDFRDGWNGMCIPYGGDGNSRICEIDESLK